METFYYRRLEVYQNAKQLAIHVNDTIKCFPKEERYALTDQLRRASSSILFNIAEAFGRYSANDRLRFLEFSSGSAMEVSSELELAEAYGYISREDLSSFDEQILVIVKQVSKLRSTIKTQV